MAVTASEGPIENASMNLFSTEIIGEFLLEIEL